MSTTTLAVLFAVLLLLLSSLAKEYIPAACLLLALVSTLANTAAQHRRIEKLEDEYKGQRSINRACLERHKAALSKQEQENLARAAEKTCVRVHYKERDVATEGLVKHLKESNADLTDRVVGLLKRDAMWQERLDAVAGERAGLRVEVKRIADEMALWRAEALEYEGLWKREGEKNSSRSAATAAATAAAETKACNRVHYEDHDSAAQRTNEELQRVLVDLRQQVLVMQRRDGRFQETVDRIQQERNALRRQNVELERDTEHWKLEAFKSGDSSRRHERAWRIGVEKKRAANDKEAEM
jgi:hypothetical protein